MREREEVLTYFGWQTCVMGDECCHDECRIPVQMADEIVRLRAQLTTAERERDEARRERVTHALHMSDVVAEQAAQLTEARTRAERAGRVVEAAKRLDAAWYIASVTDEGLGLPPLMRCVPEIRSLCEAVRAFDAHHASEGEG